MKLKKNIVKRVLFFVFVSVSAFACSQKNELDTPKNEEPTENDSAIPDYETLTFTPNESFFSPVGTLLAHLRDKTTGNEYNKNEYYDYIHEWKALEDTIIYGIDIKIKGNLIIKPEMGVPANQDGAIIQVYLADRVQEVELASTGSESNYDFQKAATFKNVTPGFYEVKLKIKSLKTPNAIIGQLKNLHITGAAAKNAKNIMRRYRAKAVHCKWETASTNPVEISVHELTIATTSQNFYQPITTPFGYTGSTWNLKTQTFGGYNFSLWSYGANDPVPPFYQESHLIAVGPGLEFGSYGHEGTGVKPRGNHPYIGINTNVQTIAVRKEPGEVYDTYWSYYLDPNDGHWKLYGCGKKFNKSGEISYLTTGAFVEVPGAASKVRNGHRLSETHYRGWQLDTSGNWHPINTMVGTTGLNGLSYRNWGIINNKFSMTMGGWGEPDIEKKELTLANPDPAPNYLKGEYLKELYKMPAVFTHNNPIEILKNTAQLSFNIADLGSDATATIFWGTEEGLTKEEKWQNSKIVPIKIGDNSIKLDNLEENTTYFYRLKIKNNQGIIWSFNTQKFNTK